jgi:hypothetical protein
MNECNALIHLISIRKFTQISGELFVCRKFVSLFCGDETGSRFPVGVLVHTVGGVVGLLGGGCCN